MLHTLLTLVVLAQPVAAQPPPAQPAPATGAQAQPSDKKGADETKPPADLTKAKPVPPESGVPGTDPAAKPGAEGAPAKPGAEGAPAKPAKPDAAGDPCDPDAAPQPGKKKKEMPPVGPRTDLEPGTYWMPPAASVNVKDVNWLFYGILAISIFCFAGITIAVVWFSWKYRHRPGHRAEPSDPHNDTIEITWTIIPSIVCVIIFIFGWRGFLDLNTPPKHAYEIQVVAEKWNWTFRYPNGWVDSNLHVPVNEPVRLVMRSKDVLHSFYIPAFRVKQDVIPNRYTKLWFEATKAGRLPPVLRRVLRHRALQDEAAGGGAPVGRLQAVPGGGGAGAARHAAGQARQVPVRDARLRPVPLARRQRQDRPDAGRASGVSRTRRRPVRPTWTRTTSASRSWSRTPRSGPVSTR